MPARPDATSPITDPVEAQRFDLSSRMLRVIFLTTGTMWLFVAVLVAILAKTVPIAVLVAVVGTDT